ncbi:hypothetical protein Ddye_031385 [Dipteronia dyeriana]|uniref:non-specific serine/threonine protein kinase n=1 Tax=Dipteronia dyeriana TaxID=168575 RepID=A0AAD9TJ68_9ROSI|nr:hypothetical protein Ddye_031385 [Dipteronia dyeriana]
MGGSGCCCCLLLMTLLASYLVSSASTSNTGPVISVSKHLCFNDFNVENSRTNIHDQVKLLGSANFSKEKGTIQIPDGSQFDFRHQAGRAIYSSPVRLLDPISHTPASFQTTFSFQFSNVSSPRVNNSQGEVPVPNHGGGSGLTFIIVPDEFTVGRPGPWLGMLNDACQENYKAVAVEFDTHHNPEIGDLNDNHLGINLGSIVSSKAVDVSDFGVFFKDGSVHRAWISYDGVRRWMEIRLGSDGQNYPTKPIFSGFLDISPFLNEYMFIGFSASTGNMTQIHNVLSWNFSSTSQASLRIPSSETCLSKNMLQETYNNNRSTPHKSSKTEPPHGFLIFIAVTVLSLTAILGFYCYGKRQRNRKLKAVAWSEKKQRPRPPNKPRRFTLSEISSATRGFSELEILGSDSRGVYYRGKLSNGCQVAVKRFSSQFLSSQQGLDKRRLVKEIGDISRVRHPNLVPIRGWCHVNRQTMVVYEFYSNGSLDKWLFGSGVLPWSRRLKVIKDVAEALSFLQSKQLAHKNMKTSSVFLDVSFRAVLGDFGFVLSGNESRRFESAVSQKADVFEFGVFVLEVVSGRRRRLDDEEVDLVEFAWRMHESDEKVKAVDLRMGSLVNMEQAIRVIEIGLLCTLNESKGRPSMEDLVEFLSLKTELPELPTSRPIALFPYNSSTALCTTGYSCAPFN